MRNRLFSIVGLVAGSMLMASAANATAITIGLQYGSEATVTTMTPTTSGVISDVSYANYDGLYHGFVLSIGALVGATPDLFSHSMNISSSNAAGTLRVYFTESGINFPTEMPAHLQFLSSFTSNLLTSGWSVTEETYLDTGNGVFTTTTLLGSHLFTAIGSSVQGIAFDVLTGPYSLTEVYTITATGAGTANSTIDLLATVAEPASLLLLGAGLVGIGWTARRRRKA